MVVKNRRGPDLQFPLTPVHVDLSHLTQEQIDALNREAISRGCTLSQFLGQLIDEVSVATLSGPPAAGIPPAPAPPEP